MEVSEEEFNEAMLEIAQTVYEWLEPTLRKLALSVSTAMEWVSKVLDKLAKRYIQGDI